MSLPVQSLELPIKLEVKFPLPDGRTLVQGPLTYDQDGLACRHNCDFMSDPRFAEAYRVGMIGGDPDTKVHWRVHVALWAASLAARLEGDFVECGVNTGILSGAIMHWLAFEKLAPRQFYLFDTFGGIPVEQISSAEQHAGIAGMNRKYQNGDQIYATATRKFARWPNAKVVRGKVPETLPILDGCRIAYLSLDMNVAAAEIAALEYLWPRLVPGATVLLDDYGWAAHINQKHAFDQFSARVGVPILALPTGQGLLLKPA